MIVKDEELVLSRCLNSVKGLVDEIVIVDTGSSDNTINIAKKFTDNVYNYMWIDDFSAARNYSFDKASGDYVMWLDADDVITSKDKKRLIELKHSIADDVDMVVMRYNVGFDSNGDVIFWSSRERIFKRSRKDKWHGVVHEFIHISGNVIYSDIAITHKNTHKLRGYGTKRNVAIYEKMLKKTKLDARGLYYYARELMDSARLCDSAKYFNEFLDGGEGWVEDNINACYCLCTIMERLGDGDSGLDYALKSMRYGAPRAEICCWIGYYYKHRKNYLKAIEWFNLAIHLPKIETIGFVSADYYNYIPAIELCVCYDKIGNKIKAIEYNEIAGHAKPKSKEYAFNKAYLDKL